MIGEFKVNLKEFGTWGETMNLELGAWRSSVRLSEYEETPHTSVVSFSLIVV